MSRQSCVAPTVVESYLAGSLPTSRTRLTDQPRLSTVTFTRREELALVRLAAGSKLDITAIVAFNGITILELIVIAGVAIFRREPSSASA